MYAGVDNPRCAKNQFSSMKPLVAIVALPDRRFLTCIMPDCREEDSPVPSSARTRINTRRRRAAAGRCSGSSLQFSLTELPGSEPIKYNRRKKRIDFMSQYVREEGRNRARHFSSKKKKKETRIEMRGNGTAGRQAGNKRR